MVVRNRASRSARPFGATITGVVLLAWSCFTPSTAIACIREPEHLRDSPQTMVLRTPTIVLAKVMTIEPINLLHVSAEAYLRDLFVPPAPGWSIGWGGPSPIEAYLSAWYLSSHAGWSIATGLSSVKFETVKAVRGHPSSHFSLHARFGDESLGDLSGHRDPRFWRFGFGAHTALRNTFPLSSCGDFVGMFNVGEQYLVFLDGPDYPTRYENVKSEDDLWYLTVVDVINTLNALECPDPKRC